MSSLVRAGATGDGTVATPSSAYAGWWKINEGTGTTLTDSSAAGNNLEAGSGGISAGFWGTNGRGTFVGGSNDDAFGIGDLTSIELGTATGSKPFIISFRMNKGNVAAVTAAIGKYHNTGSTGVLIDVQADTDGRIRLRANGTNSPIGTTDLTDGLDHHIVVISDDQDGKDRIYIDNVEEASATHNTADCISTTGEFGIGFRNISDTPEIPWNGGLYDAHLLMPSSIPSNSADIVDWLYRHPYQQLPASMLA